MAEEKGLLLGIEVTIDTIPRNGCTSYWIL
jgi:hypothetical protein